MKKIFISFADSRLVTPRNRLKRQAYKLNFFDKIFIADESNLDQDFRYLYKDKLTPDNRGYGYWSWKPQIVSQEILQAKDGDLIMYSDIGSHLNVNGKKRLFQYFDMVEKSKSGILAFSFDLNICPFSLTGYKVFDYPIMNWTKGDLIDFFCIRNKPDLLSTQTIWAGAFVIKVCDSSRDLFTQWTSVIDHDFSLIDDSQSLAPNLPGFVEHRHDQAIFSILCRLNDVKLVSAYETILISKTNNRADWHALSSYPVHAKRDKRLGLLARIQRRLKVLF